MDSMGDAEYFDQDDDVVAPAPLLTAETRAIAGAGLVLISVVATTIFQFVSLLIFNRGQSTGPTTQYALIAGPSAVLAVAGAALGWSTRTRPLSPALRGTAGAAVIVGGSIAVLVAGSIVLGYALDTNGSNF